LVGYPIRVFLATFPDSMNDATTSYPILYSFRRCPYAMRARITIVKSKQVVELREVVLRDKPASMIQYSKKGTVPVLVLEDGMVIDESLDIMKWALKLSDPDSWLVELGDNLLKENDGTFKKLLDRYKYSNRHPEHSQEYYRKQGETFLQKLEYLLSGHTFLSGDQMRFIDIAILPFVRQFAYVDIAWFDTSSYVNVRRWLDTFLYSTLFGQVMRKHEQWHEGDEPVLFP
jgi:glutathione S-transferase